MLPPQRSFVESIESLLGFYCIQVHQGHHWPMTGRWLRRGSISDKLKSSLALSLMLMLQYTFEFYRDEIVGDEIEHNNIMRQVADANRFYNSLTLFRTYV